MKTGRALGSKIWKAFLYCLYLGLAVFFLLEILLRVYNPFALRLKGDKILLPVNQKLMISNTINPRLDRNIIHTRNSMGLRGPEMPPHFEDMLSVITVGGSTTACHFLNDDSTWPSRLGRILSSDFRRVWMNNAGLDGHSTFGHQILLNDHLVHIRPKVIVFLTGVNDIENDTETFHDKLYTKGAYPGFVHYLYNNSEVLNLAVNIFRGYRAQKFNNTTHILKLPEPGNDLLLSAEKIRERLEKQTDFLPAYERRLEGLIDTCLRHRIFPIFLTQPVLYGEGRDSVTKADLAATKLDTELNGLLFWRILEQYNQRLRDVCASRNIPMIDLAKKMPKNSWYFYDGSHYTNEGAAAVAGIVAADVKDILARQFPEFLLSASPP